MKTEIYKLTQHARKINITSDIWSQKGCTNSYLGVTAHFFDPERKELIYLTLAVREFRNPHTGEFIAEELTNILDEFGVSDKLFYLVSDNGSNIVKAARMLKAKGDKEAIEEDLPSAIHKSKAIDCFFDEEDLEDEEDEDELQMMNQEDIDEYDSRTDTIQKNFQTMLNNRIGCFR